VRRQCQAASEERLAARLEKITERRAADAQNMECSGAELIAFFLSPDRHPPGRQWSRKHAHTQGRLCARFVAPVIGHLVCEDIKTGHLQAVVRRRQGLELNSSTGAITLINHALMSGDPGAAALLRRPEPPAREPPEREAEP